MKYKVELENDEKYTVHAPDITSEAQLIWLALNEAGWADHPYSVTREDDEIRIKSERLSSALTIKPVI